MKKAREPLRKTTSIISFRVKRTEKEKLRAEIRTLLKEKGYRLYNK
jgi:hypothetical protein